MISSLADHALLYALAMLVHLVWYAWPARPITAQGLHRFLYTLGIKLNRKKRSAASLVWRGLIILLLILATATAAGYGLSLLARLAPPYSWAMEVIILAWLLRLIPAQQRLIHLSRALREQGERPTTELAHRFEPMRDQPVDAYAALRRGAEDAVRAYTDLFLLGIAYLLGGLTVFVPLACLSLCALFYGRSTRETLAFGWAASRLWGGLLWPFERLAAAWLCFAALIAAQCHPVKAWAGLNHWVGCRLRYPSAQQQGKCE